MDNKTSEKKAKAGREQTEIGLKARGGALTIRTHDRRVAVIAICALSVVVLVALLLTLEYRRMEADTQRDTAKVAAESRPQVEQEFAGNGGRNNVSLDGEAKLPVIPKSIHQSSRGNHNTNSVVIH